MDEAHDMSPTRAAPSGLSRGARMGLRAHIWGVGANVILLAALLFLVGCSATATTSSTTSSGTPGATSAASTRKVCQYVATINQVLAQLATVGDSTTVGEVKAIQQKLTTALNAVAKLPNSGGSVLSNLQSINDQLAAAIENLPDSATVGQVGTRLQTFKSKVSQAQAGATKLAATLHCTS